MLAYRLNSSENAPAFALINGGGVRATIDEGPITRGEVLTAFPFGNAIVEVTLTGQRLWDTLEGIVSGVNLDNGKPVTSFLQVSRGIVIKYNPAANNGSRLLSVTLGDKPLDKAAEYRVVTVDFLSGGGDNFFSPSFSDIPPLDTLDEVLVDYIAAQSPIDVKLDGRIVKAQSTCKRSIPRGNKKRRQT